MSFQADHPVYLAIRRQYEMAKLGPRAPLKISQLADRHVSSTIPVREALVRLTSEDVAEQIPGQGFHIRSVSLDEMLIHYQICRTLYEMALNDLERLEHVCLRSSVSINEVDLRPADDKAETKPEFQERRIRALGGLILNPTQNKIYKRSLLITCPVRWIMHGDPELDPNISEYLETLLPCLKARRFAEARKLVTTYFESMQSTLRTPYEMYSRQFS
ncbi:GntR family transcriptional regulator [uncultured Tateyamaria sp.]|uniref:GntR family transcriptional regulator n=1 Tax=uncultured Tateyamaria sp. TaxID=455651 RepID=UPI0026365499|nr:GntR family transcriptional regulator [uncultured Tateyamaria sp.]